MSWNQLLSMIQEARQSSQQEISQPPVACPIDGAILDVGPTGIRNCPMGNFRWPS